MRSVYNSLDPWSCAFPNIAVGLPTVLYWYFARHCCWHPNFQLSSSGFHCELQFIIDEMHSSQLSGIIEFWFLDSTSLICFLLCCIRHTRPHIWPYIVTTKGILFTCKSPPDHVFPSVRPVHASDTRSSDLQHVSPS